MNDLENMLGLMSNEELTAYQEEASELAHHPAKMVKCAIEKDAWKRIYISTCKEVERRGNQFFEELVASKIKEMTAY